MLININKFLKPILINKNREKRKFLLAGILNVLLTNLCLQIFLFLNLFTIFTSTFLSQLINMAIGYAIYSKFIFKVKNFKNLKFIKKYFLLMLILWILNWYGIKAGIFFGISSNLSAFILIPLLAPVSYVGQKVWVFK